MSHGRIGDLSHKARMRYVEELRARLGTGKKRKSVVQFPDLRVEQRTAPTSDRIVAASTAPKVLPAGANTYPIGNSHKQGYELLTPGTIAAGHLKHMNGKKT